MTTEQYCFRVSKCLLTVERYLLDGFTAKRITPVGMAPRARDASMEIWFLTAAETRQYVQSEAAARICKLEKELEKLRGLMNEVRFWDQSEMQRRSEEPINVEDIEI